VRSFRFHWPAIVVAMIVSFLFEAGWFSYFMVPWAIGIGRSEDWAAHPIRALIPLQFAVALLCSFVAATVLSYFIQKTGEQTLVRGVKTGVLVWLGFMVTTLAKNYIFEVRPPSLYAINLTYTLVDMVLIGAIVGAWKGKRPPEPGLVESSESAGSEQ
jgi:hypothetical protein